MTAGFESPARLIVNASRLFTGSLGWLAIVTLAVCVPGKLVVQSALAAFEVAPDGVAAYLVSYGTDLVWTALLAAAVIHGLSHKLRDGKLPACRTSLAWAWKLWGVMLWNVFKVEITVLLWSLLLVVPGVIAMIRLILTEPVVALEGAAAADALARSRELTQGRTGRIALALAPMVPIGAAHMYATFRSLQASPFLMVGVDSVFTILDQWGTAAALLIYLGVAQMPDAMVATARAPAKTEARRGARLH